MVNTKLYVEGGGDRRETRTACRRGFEFFLRSAGLSGRMPRVVPCGRRDNAYDDFKTAHMHNDEVAMLLVDAEGPVTAAGPWAHLAKNGGKDSDWKRPKGAKDRQCHLMVQMMESWFLADKDALASLYGDGFRKNALPQNLKIEQIPKEDVRKGLERATRDTNKGAYHKGKHSFAILALLDPVKVTAASPYADRLIKAL
ncbi:MAG: DUF4276 family protein [Chloroflexota bacterium]|nr:DUF4276 family protein [Chloroflexota bacterium]